MQTETITQVKKFKLIFEKFDDWVYIKCSDRKDSFLLTRKHFDAMEAKHAKSKVPYNWILKINWIDAYNAFSTEYLKQYFETGNWSPGDYKTWIINALPLLRKGIKNRYFQGDVSSSGFLTINNKFVRRPYPLELCGYRSKTELLKKLLKNPKVLSAEIKEIPYYMESKYVSSIHIIYIPSVREFDKFVENKIADSGFEVCWDIEKRLNIKRFKLLEDD